MITRGGRRVTLADVARAAGVGSATVDRVINERGNVSDDISRKVLAVARDLGLNRRLPQSYRRMIRIEVLLSRPELPLIERMHHEFRRLATQLDTSIVIHRTTLKNDQISTIRTAMRQTQCDAVLVYAPDDPEIRAAVTDLWRREVPVVTLISDLPETERIAYAGPDHYQSGRTAGYFISMMARAPGSVVVLCNNTQIQSHSGRIKGIRDALSDRAPHLRVAAVVEGRDERARSAALLQRAFADYPDTVAVYNVGAANLGVEAAIRSGVLSTPPIFVGHELTVHTARLLRDGVMALAIDQSPEIQVRLAVNHVLRHFDFAAAMDAELYGTRALDFVLYSPENVPRVLQA